MFKPKSQTRANTLQTNVDTATKQRKYDILERKRLDATDDDHYAYKILDRAGHYIYHNSSKLWNSTKRFFVGN